MLARHLAAERGPQVLSAALLAPQVKPSGRRTVPEREVLVRDDELLASLDPAGRNVFTAIAVHQDEPGWTAFRDHVLPGIRAHHREDAAELRKADPVSRTPESVFGAHLDRPAAVRSLLGGWLDTLANRG
ncbi:hypothetical protein GCM10022222_31880 [Amycolatopsis ultiminotia]|uniref:Uncharacterized protein n=1 Tax=Amycolatopsis ultiminotia TaxID=543629 RepID=A0ABP6W5P7_9PSEU